MDVTLSVPLNYVEKQMCIEVKQYRTDHGEKVVLVGKKGRTLMPILMMESGGLVVKRVPLTDARYMRDVMQSGKSKSIKTCIRQFRAFGKRTGMSKAAKSFLTDANKLAV